MVLDSHKHKDKHKDREHRHKEHKKDKEKDREKSKHSNRPGDLTTNFEFPSHILPEELTLRMSAGLP
ncbi:UNVERIFIED_CONTAM: hypothetical protein K2H54_066076 [Gekko kuhli]